MTIEKLEIAKMIMEELKGLNKLYGYLSDDKNTYIFTNNCAINDAIKLPDEVKKDIREIILNYEAKVKDQFKNL